ncbi:hypothetical protein LTR84_003532 [Exophiala bonariae]|uniref:DCG1-like protein n=1 Tax=Exophiala bonariae TaxID=1690606 RepID=A0AAV9N7K8_9EURO|nr:hypothetical protein LTR84_003532 [Exophiala bonariae]
MASNASSPSALRILIINPNTSTSMTEALVPLLDSLAYPPGFVKYTFFTSPATPAEGINVAKGEPEPRAIPSINSHEDADESAKFCLPYLQPLLADHDAFLVACYSQHPLVFQLKTLCAALDGPKKYVTGIFEASVLASLALTTHEPEPLVPEKDRSRSYQNETFGIVSTGKIWEEILGHAVDKFLSLGEQRVGAERHSRFAGVETTGLNATDLHDLPADQVRVKMIEATKQLLRKSSSVGAICLGCAGMAGLDDAVRQACVEELGESLGGRVRIVDGVKAGVSMLVGLAMAGF